MHALSIMYHDVVENADYESSGFPGAGANIYKLRREDFARQLDAIRAAVPEGTVSLMPRRRQMAGRPPVLLTFDDGGASFYDPIAGMLEERGWRGHFFITTGRIGTAGFLSAPQLRELHSRGHAIGSHSHSHPTRMAALGPEQIGQEWKESVARLADILGEAVQVASAPGGYYSRTVARMAAAAGIEVLFNSEPTSAATVTEGCLVLGRYVVMQGMGPEWAAGFAAGRILPRWRQAALWKAKGIAKALGGAAYLKLRQKMLER
jgi:peptidoglycan/xylan/chitin deacetylase (PgdA/CDA1 family)